MLLTSCNSKPASSPSAQGASSPTSSATEEGSATSENAATASYDGGTETPESTDPETVYYHRSIMNEGNPARIAAAMKKAIAGEPVTIGVIGGSITFGNAASDTNTKSWAALMKDWWVEKFPQAQITFVNAGIGATGSLYGVHRVDRDLLGAKPDFVVVEYSVNDMGVSSATETYEGLVRKILQSDNRPGVLNLDMMNSTGSSWGSHFVEVNKNYQLPMVSYREAVWPKVQDGELKWSELAPDDVHPNDNGHAMTADLIIHYLNDVLEKVDAIAAPDYSLPSPITANGYERSAIYNNLNLTATSNGGWQPYSYQGLWGDGWMATEKGEPLVLEVTGGYVTINYAKFTLKDRGAKAYVMIDDQTRVDFTANFNGGWGDYMETKILLSDSGSGKHKLAFFYDDEPYGEFRLVSVMVANQ